MLRRTKIIVTLGPATDNKKVLSAILSAGVNVVRINCSHDNADKHLSRINNVREWAAKNNTYIGVIMDLQGPKIRIEKFKNGAITLNNGSEFILDVDKDKNSGDELAVGISYKKLAKEVTINDMLLLDDGRIIIKVTAIKNNQIICKVIQGGVLSNNKGINLRGGGLSAKALTNKDKKDILTAASIKADYVALSFPTSGDDVRQVKKLLAKVNCEAGVIAKIERTEALVQEVILDIIKESAGIMIARGDLGVEIGDPLLPAQQKRLIKLARSNDRFVITATQMLESMITNPIATRAEIFDVANAVLDGTDCVMLSAETATGKFPVNTVKTMHEVCLETEKNPIAKISHHRLGEKFARIDETIAMSTMYAANHFGAKAIVHFTESGQTALMSSRMSSNIPIFAMSNRAVTLTKITLYRGVYPYRVNHDAEHDWSIIKKIIVKCLASYKIIKNNDFVVITKGADFKGGTNSMKIIRINI